MTTLQPELRRWLDVITSQLGRVDIRLADVAYPVELTANGEAAYRFLVQSRETLERGYMIRGEEVRRALDLFMLEHRSAFRRRLDFLTDPQPAPTSHQEVFVDNRIPSGQPHTFPSDEAGSLPNNQSPQPGPSRNENEGEVNTTYLIWDSQIVDADGDPADVVITRRWFTHENGLLILNIFIVDRSGIPVHIPSYINRGHVRRICPSQLRRG